MNKAKFNHMYRKLYILFLTFLLIANISVMAYTKDDYIALAQVQAQKAIKARLGNNTKVKFRYVNGKPDCWISGNSYVVYGTANGINFGCDVIIDTVNDKVYVKSLSF